MLHHSRIGVNGTKAQRPNGATVQQRIGVIEKGENGRGGDWGTKRRRDRKLRTAGPNRPKGARRRQIPRAQRLGNRTTARQCLNKKRALSQAFILLNDLIHLMHTRVNL